MNEAENFIPFNNQKVLLVDDNVSSLIITTSLLTAWNLEVHIASNGLEAVKRVLTERFDILLMDIDMPVLKGTKAARQIRRLDACFGTIPILAFSALEESVAEHLVKEFSMNGFIAKPYTSTQMYDALQKHLNHPQQ